MNSQGSHLSQSTLALIKAIGDSRSKQEEDKIIAEECRKLKGSIKESKVSSKKMKECLIRAIYVEMLGHEAPFSHLYAVNLTQDKNLLNKRVGYLACSLLLSDQSEFLIMLIASLQKDIQSTKWLEVCMALICVAKFANTMIVQAISEPISKLLNNKNEHIRKKALVCLYKFYQINPTFVPDCDEKMRRLLLFDIHPSVMGATLPYFKEMVMKTPEMYKDLVTHLISILKQIIDKKLTKDFEYHCVPAPWIQVTILEILSILGKDDQSSSENMYEIISLCLRKGDESNHNIGHAIVYQCLKTICTIYPNAQLVELASTTISKYLQSESPNLRCTGIYGLTLIIKINPGYVMNHQHIIVDCLEVNDETLKKNTFELLYQMTTLKNVEIIVEKMINYLSHTTLESINKKDILTKITELSERFAPNKRWFIRIMNQLFVKFGKMITEDLLTKFIKIINEWERETDDEEEFKLYTIENYATLLENYAVLPDSFVKLMAWVIGEYTNKIYQNDHSKIEKILQMVIYLLNKTYDDETTKSLLISAIAKIHSNIDFIQLDFINEVFEKYSRDKNTEIQQRCIEYKRLKAHNKRIEKNTFLALSDECTIDSSLSFLNQYVKENSKGKVYDEDYADQFCNKFISNDFQLNIGPYADPSNLLSMPSKQAQINSLYQGDENNLKMDMRRELKVVGEKKWDEEGYRDQKQEEQKIRVAIPLTVSSVYNPIIKKPKEEKKIDNAISKEKQDLMNSLFVDINNKDNKPKIQSNPIQPQIHLQSQHQQQPQPQQHPQQQQQKPSINLLNTLNNGTPMNSQTNKPKPVEKPFQNPSSDTFDILSGLLGTPITQQQSIPQTANLMNQTQNKGQAEQANNANVFNQFDFTQQLQPQPQSQKQNDNLQLNQKSNYVSFKIETDDLANLWESLPEEREYNIKVNVNSPDQFHHIISSKGNFYPVAIDSNEAISSAKYKNQIVLVHATIEQGNVPLKVKCQNETLTNEIANFIMNLFQ